MLIDKEALDEMNNNWDSVAQDAFIIDKESYSNASKLWATTKIREHYFGSRLVGNETLINLTNAYTDALFMYTAKKTALAHAKYAPVYTTMLTFKGIWSQTFPYGFTQVLGKYREKSFIKGNTCLNLQLTMLVTFVLGMTHAG